MSFSELPIELLQLISIYLCDEEMQAWSLTSRTMHVLLHKLWNSSLFWRERYSVIFRNDYCCVDNLLPQTIAFYGWKTLYFRVQLANTTPTVSNEYRVGVTGNLYIHLNNEWSRFLSLPMREMIWSCKLPSEQIIILYLNYDGIIECILCQVREELLYNIIFPPFGTEKVLQHYIDDHCLIILFDKGDVWTNLQHHEIKKLCCYLDNITHGIISLEDLGFEMAYSPSAGYFPNSKRIIFVDTFQVQIYDNISNSMIVTWPRTSEEHLNNLSDTIKKHRQVKQ